MIIIRVVVRCRKLVFNSEIISSCNSRISRSNREIIIINVIRLAEINKLNKLNIKLSILINFDNIYNFSISLAYFCVIFIFLLQISLFYSC